LLSKALPAQRSLNSSGIRKASIGARLTAHQLARRLAGHYYSTVIDLPEHIYKSIRRRQLFCKGQTILVAVSGGLDSMVLLKVLHELCSRDDWKLVVAHLDHQLRGNASRADARLVSNTARKLRLPLVTEKADVRRLAQNHKLSLEMAARKLRHDFFARTAMGLGIPTIALAHHADDQLELFFLRLFRGSGGDALGGMKWRSSSPGDDQVALARPLLDLPKEVLQEFASQRRIPFREDASNRSLDFQRNRIRHELLPLLRRHYQK